MDANIHVHIAAAQSHTLLSVTGLLGSSASPSPVKDAIRLK